MIQISPTLSIPSEEITFKASRSGGPGGQNVNKVSSRIALRFDVLGSPSLSGHQKRRLLDQLPTRISRDGVLQVVAQGSRSQAANREAARERFVQLVRKALTPRKTRQKTRVPGASRQARLDQKWRRSRLKRGRSKRHDSEE